MVDVIDRPGKKPGGSDDRELFARNFSDDVLKAWDETFDFVGETTVRTITSGRSDVIPVSGKKRDALDHIPGTEIRGGDMQHNEIEITLDHFTVDSVFIPEIDELMLHYSMAGIYTHQLGFSLAAVSNYRIASTMVLSSRRLTPTTPDGPLGGYHYDANMLTDASKLEDAAYKGVEYIRTNDIGGGKPKYWLPHQQYLLLARYTGIDTEATSGSGDRAQGIVGWVAGIQPKGTNSLPPRQNITTGLPKYRGDFTNTVGIIATSQAVGSLKRRPLKIVIKPRDERLGTQIIASQLEGHGALRGEAAFEVRNAVRP